MSPKTVLPGTPFGGAPPLCIAIGASAGGPAAIEAVLSAFPWNFPVPILVCQHMTDGATGPWAERLNGACHVRVVEAKQAELLLPRRAYIAPVGRHLRVRGTAASAHISLEPDLSGTSHHVPSIDELMRSVAHVFGSRSLGVLLTGMGCDGAEGLLAIRRAGGTTIVQSPDSAFMRSMPAAATELGAAGEVLPLERIAEAIAERVAGRL